MGKVEEGDKEQTFIGGEIKNDFYETMLLSKNL